MHAFKDTLCTSPSSQVLLKTHCTTRCVSLQHSAHLLPGLTILTKKFNSHVLPNYPFSTKKNEADFPSASIYCFVIYTWGCWVTSQSSYRSNMCAGLFSSIRDRRGARRRRALARRRRAPTESDQSSTDVYGRGGCALVKFLVGSFRHFHNIKP